MQAADQAAETRKKRIDKTWEAFLYSLAGVLLPFLISFLAVTTISRYCSLLSFLDKGEVLLFAVALLVSSFYIFQDDQNKLSLKRKEYKIDQILSHLIWIMLILTSAVYGIVYILGVIQYQIDIWFLRGFSLVSFILAAYISFRSINIDLLKVYPDVDVAGITQDAIDDIANAF